MEVKFADPQELSHQAPIVFAYVHQPAEEGLAKVDRHKASMKVWPQIFQGPYHSQTLVPRRCRTLFVDVEIERPLPDVAEIPIRVCLEQRSSKLVISGVGVQRIWGTLLGESEHGWCGSCLDQGQEFCKLLWVQKTDASFDAFLGYLIQRTGYVCVSREVS